MLVKFANVCGATVCKSWNPSVTHVIAATDEKGACTRTLKVLMAILGGKWILTIDCKLSVLFCLAWFSSFFVCLILCWGES